MSDSFKVLFELDDGSRRFIEVIRGTTIGELKTKHGWKALFLAGCIPSNDTKVDVIEESEATSVRVVLMK